MSSKEMQPGVGNKTDEPSGKELVGPKAITRRVVVGGVSHAVSDNGTVRIGEKEYAVISGDDRGNPIIGENDGNIAVEGDGTGTPEGNIILDGSCSNANVIDCGRLIILNPDFNADEIYAYSIEAEGNVTVREGMEATKEGIHAVGSLVSTEGFIVAGLDITSKEGDVRAKIRIRSEGGEIIAPKGRVEAEFVESDAITRDGPRQKYQFL